MKTREMLRLSWRAWLSQSEARVGPWWIGTAWTIVFCAAVAIVFTVFSMMFGRGRGQGDPGSLAAWWAWFQVNLVLSLCIGFAVRGAFALAMLAIGRARLATALPWQRSLYFLVVPLLGVAAGWPVGLWLAMGIDVRLFFTRAPPQLLVGSVLVAILITGLFQQFFWSKARQIRAENQATEAQLRLLQAQIEPHFLFNTLANVTALMDTDTARARAMLESFVDYLRASLSGLGHAGHTLGDEIDLVDAYMRIVKIRMEDRLDYAIDVPAALRALPLPALTLQPLVENAIVHGLEPQIAGGFVRVAARREGRTLVISVDDDGAGLASTGPAAATLDATRRAGTGTALANIRLRLRQTYGSDASLSLEPGQPRGIRAALRVPLPARAAATT